MPIRVPTTAQLKTVWNHFDAPYTIENNWPIVHEDEEEDAGEVQSRQERIVLQKEQWTIASQHYSGPTVPLPYLHNHMEEGSDSLDDGWIVREQ